MKKRAKTKQTEVPPISIDKTRERLSAALGVFSLLIGVGLSLWAFLPSISSSWAETTNIFFVDPVDVQTGSVLQDNTLAYTVELLIVPNSNDIGVVIDTIGEAKGTDNYKHKIRWPGHVEDGFPVWQGDLTVKAGDYKTDEKATYLETSSHGYKDNDHFEFAWIDGRERVNFSDSRIRLAGCSKCTIKVQFFGSYEIVREAPTHVKEDVDAIHDLITYTFPEGQGVSLVISNPEYKKISQYIVLVSGVLLGFATNLLTNPLLDLIISLLVKRNKKLTS